MRVDILPSIPQGQITAPPSKSIAHRLILCAALANGKSEIRNIALSQDVQATIDCVNAFGAYTEYKDGMLTVTGADIDRLRFLSPLNCRECGSTVRFLLPLCMLTEEETVLTGSLSLLSRPMSIYEDICVRQGIPFVKTEREIRVGGKLHPDRFFVPGDISSQFVSGLLFVLPLLKEDSSITLTGKIESRPYIELTMAAQAQFGVGIQWTDQNTLFLKGNQRYVPVNVENEGDWSNAAFLYALNKCGYPVNVSGVQADSLQGDKICISYFDLLKTGYVTLDVSDCPDLAPVLFAFAAMHHGGSFTGTKRLKLKESDRAEAMAKELIKFGVKTVIEEDRVLIPSSKPHAPDAVLYGHNDHRIVMSLAVMCVKFGGVIEGAEAVNKSYPIFFEDLEKLKVKITYEAG